jgi:hypothetical protein
VVFRPSCYTFLFSVAWALPVGGSWPEYRTPCVEVQGGRELLDERHTEEHKLGQGVPGEDIYVVGAGGARPDGSQAVTVHRDCEPSDPPETVSSKAVFGGEAEARGLLA